jgi:hypothetical protein
MLDDNRIRPVPASIDSMTNGASVLKNLRPVDETAPRRRSLILAWSSNQKNNWQKNTQKQR